MMNFSHLSLFVLALVTLVATSDVSVETPGASSDLHAHSERATRLSWAQVRSLYGLTYSATSGTGQTIAIVMYGDYGSAAADLATFSSQNGLPSCTTSNGCISAVGPYGSCTNLGTAAATVQATVVQTVHAMAPGAKILYVCAPSPNQALQSVRYASQHANFVVIPFGMAEYSGQSFTFDPYFSQAGVSFFAAAGDASAVQYPSTSSYVVAVGGTSVSGSGPFSSTAWSKTGGGCSIYNAATTAQLAYSQYGAQGCNGKKSVPDVAMIADPASVPAIYYGGNWIYPGGTAFASAVAVSLAADSGTLFDSSFIYGGFINFRDITSGTSGILSAKTGMDKVSGLGEMSTLFGQWSSNSYGGVYAESRLGNGESIMINGNWLVSKNRRFIFNFYAGSMQVSEIVQGQVWSSSFSQSTLQAMLVMQTDGNLVMYETLLPNGGSTHTPVWSSNTAGVGTAPYYLILQCDGDLVIYDATQYVVWASGTHMASWPGNGYAINQ